MKHQKPAEGILKTSEYGDTKFYSVACSCTDPEHSHQLVVESESDGITLTIYHTAFTSFDFMTRFKHIWNILTKGYSEYDASLVMSEQQAFNYAETIKVAIKDIAIFKAQEEENRNA